MPAVNEYDTFSYEKPADYIPRLKETYGEINEGFARAEQMARINDQQRLANAQNMGKAINSAFKFSKTMGQYMEQEQDKRESIYRNRAANLRMLSGATWQGMRNWNNQDAKIKGDYTYHQHLASQFDKTDPELADELRNLTGWKERVWKEGLAKQHVVNYESNLYDAMTRQNPDGSFAYVIERDDGSTVHWGQATGSEKTELIARWEEQEGLNDISGFNAEFLNKHVTQQRQTKINTILQNERVKEEAEYTNARLQSYDDQLIVSAKHGSLGEKLHELMQIEVGNFKGDYGVARTALKGRLFALVRQGKLKPGEIIQISKFKFDHKGFKEPVDLTVFKEFQNLGGELAALAEQIHQQESAQRKARAYGIVQELKEGEKERPYTEADKRDILAKVRKNIPGITEEEMPDYIKNLMTVEAKEDQDYIDTLEYKKATSQPIERKDWVHINNADDRKKWQEYADSAAGTGIPKSISTQRDRDVHAAVGEQLNNLKGRPDEKSLDFNTLKDRAKVKYNSYYSFYKEGWTGSEGELHRKIMSLLKEDLPTMANIPLYSEDRDTRKFRRDLETARNQLKAGWTADTKTSPRDTLATVLLKDSEPYYKELEAYAANPSQGQIPSYYRKIAKNYNYLTGWDVANLQYKSQTGKELPKPYQIQRVEQYHPTVRRLFTKNPTPKGVLIRSNTETDFSKEHVTEGVQ